MKKTFAQLKRDLQVGMKIKCIINNCRDDFERKEREISIKQTNAIALKTFRNGAYCDSWLWFPKKADLVEYEDNKFSFYEEPKRWNNFTKTLLFTYEIVG